MAGQRRKAGFFRQMPVDPNEEEGQLYQHADPDCRRDQMNEVRGYCPEGAWHGSGVADHGEEDQVSQAARQGHP